MKIHLTYILLSLLIVAVMSTALLAQESAKPGSIDLEVTDQTGAVVPNAQVQLLLAVENLGTDLPTDKAGKLSVEVPAGSYELRVGMPGFVLAKQRLSVLPGMHQTIPMVLKLGGCSPCAAVGNNPEVSFPEQAKAISPDGRYAVVGDPSVPRPATHTAVFLEDLQLKTRRKFFTYDGYVRLLWNEGSSLIAATYYSGNDNSRCSIFSVDKTDPPAQALDLIVRQSGKTNAEPLKTLLSNEHLHVAAYRWKAPTELLVTLSGYGSANPTGSTELIGVTYVYKRP